MVSRSFWLRAIEDAWRRRSVVWLSGVRRVGKTFLCRSLERVEYLDCELPRVRRQLEDPEAFLSDWRGRRVVLDEIHRLPNPSELLKIAADHFPETRVLATGSSTLAATAKFRDTLAGRQAPVWLTPLMSEDLRDFGKPDLMRRLRRGGLPPFFLAPNPSERDFQEWLDAYWAKDVLELFRLERRASFQRFIELLMVRSGGIFEATAYAAPCEVSRTTVANYLQVLETTYVAHVVRPFSTHRPTEIVSAPKVYAFDTGFVFAFRGWGELRPEDRGFLWEHYVLNEMQSRTQRQAFAYWRDKRGHEVDFILGGRGRPPVAVECKWSVDAFDAAGVRAFRRQYPRGPNWLVTTDVDRPFRRTVGGVEVECLGLADLARRLAKR